MSKYLDILTKVEPNPAVEEDKRNKEAAKEEIAAAKERIAELKEDPSKSFYKVLPEPDRRDKEEFKDVIKDVAEYIMCNAEKESESVKNYTTLIFKLKTLVKSCHRIIKTLNEPYGPEMGVSDSDVKNKIEYHTNILNWALKNIEKTQDKIQDELNHNSALIADYIEFTGIKPSEEGIKEIAKTISN